MPSNWVEYDKESNRFTEKAKARLQGIIAQHYQRAMVGMHESKLEGVEAGQPTQENAEQPKAAAPTSEWEAGDPMGANATASDKAMLAVFEEAGIELYGDQWPHVKHHNIKRLIGNKPNALTSKHIQTLIDGMNKLKKQRNGTDVPA